MRRSEAVRYRVIIERSAQSLDDAAASTVAALFPVLRQDGALVEAGTRINWKGVIKRAAVALWDTEGSDPDNAPTLWEDIQYREGFRVIPPVITAGMAFALDEWGWWDNMLYRSRIADNIHTPEQNPDGWERVR